MATLLPVFLLALIDSINPSALVVTLTLLTRGSRARAILAYVGGIFVAYLSAGVLLMLGMEALFAALETALESRFAGVVGVVIGGGMLLYALIAPNPEKGADPGRAVEGARGLAGLFLLGIVVTGMELPTALPYLGATGLLARAGLGVAGWLPVLVVYNVIFVLPPLLLAAGYRFLSEQRSAAFVARLRRGARETTLWIVGIVGFYLLFGSLPVAFPSLGIQVF